MAQVSKTPKQNTGCRPAVLMREKGEEAWRSLWLEDPDRKWIIRKVSGWRTRMHWDGPLQVTVTGGSTGKAEEEAENTPDRNRLSDRVHDQTTAGKVLKGARILRIWGDLG